MMYMRNATVIVCLTLLFPLAGYAQSFSIDDIDVVSVLSCDVSSLDCRIQLVQTRALIQALLEQVLEAQMQLVLSDDDDDYYLERSYQRQLNDTPLAHGRTKSFVVENGIVDNFDDDTPAIYREVWRIFSRMVPEQFLRDFNKIKFINDSSEYFAALVFQQISSDGTEDRSTWQLEINLDDVLLGDDDEYNRTVKTIAHEAGHVMLTNATQIDFFVDEDDCVTIFLSDLSACALPGSYYDRLSEFWSDGYLDWAKEYAVIFEDDSDQAKKDILDYYEDHADEFITPYAVSSVHEDAADTIAYFSVGPKPRGNLNVKDEKIVSLYDFDEMIGFRSRTQDLLHK